MVLQKPSRGHCQMLTCCREKERLCLSESEPVDPLRSIFAIAGQFNSPHGSINSVPRIIADRGEGLAGLFQVLESADVHDAPGVVRVDGEVHRNREASG